MSCSKLRMSVALLSILILAGCNFDQSKKVAELESRLATLEARLNENTGEWVLWRSPRSYTGFAPSIAFYAQSAFSTERACIDQVVQNASLPDSRLADSDAKFKSEMIVFHTQYQDNYYCLPKAVDPRTQPR